MSAPRDGHGHPDAVAFAEACRALGRGCAEAAGLYQMRDKLSGGLSRPRGPSGELVEVEAAQLEGAALAWAAALAEKRDKFFADLLDAAAPTLMRLEALGNQLDGLAEDMPRAPTGSPERERLRAVLFGLLQGLRCCQVLTPEQTEAFTARMRQGIAEGWL